MWLLISSPLVQQNNIALFHQRNALFALSTNEKCARYLAPAYAPILDVQAPLLDQRGIHGFPLHEPSRRSNNQTSMSTAENSLQQSSGCLAATG